MDKRIDDRGAAARDDRFYSLDAMRGLAAILVVLYHFDYLMGDAVPGGYLAVDFFFGLSGFVLGRAYEAGLRSGGGAGRFMVRRLIRLYPMFALGLAFAVIVAVARTVGGSPNVMGLGQIAAALATEVFMLPSLATGVELFPLNAPAWSLSLELAINLVFALCLARLPSRWLIGVVAVAGLAVLASALHWRRLDVGWGWANAAGGVARVAFSFCLGLLIHRSRVAMGRPGLVALAPVAGLALVLAAPIPTDARALADAAITLLFSPALLLLGARLAPPKALQGVCTRLGDLSYPLYAIHFPLLLGAGFAARKLGWPPAVWAPLSVAGMVITAHLLGRHLDPAARRWLARRMLSPSKDLPSS